MFPKSSRYYQQKDMAKPDSQGRVFKSKAMRLLPLTTGKFIHVVDEADRLDTLANRYYRKPGQWWRICDANAAFLSPRGLIGKEPVRVKQVEIQWQGTIPPWHQLRQALLLQPGVDKVLFGNEQHAFPDQLVFDVGYMFSMAASLQADIDTSILAQALTASLTDAFLLEGHELADDIHIAAVADVHWRLTDLQSKAIYSIRLEEGMLNVYQGAISFSWVITVHYNEMNISDQQLIEQIESMQAGGFSVLAPITINRIGKAIVIPPTTAAGS